MIKLIQFLTCLVLIASLSINGSAQKQNNIWLIGHNVGIDFNQSPPVTFDKTPLSCTFPNFTTSICDNKGALLFYSNGDTIWNKENQPLKRFNDWWPFYQKIMPFMTTYPGNDSLYYLFGVAGHDHQLKAVIINAKANDSRGAIMYNPGSTYYNFYTPLLKNASLMVAGTGHCNQRDIWIAGHSGSALYSYLVNPGGIDTSPVVSTFLPGQIPPDNYEMGNLKFSANGEKLFMPLLKDGINKMAIFDFDNLSGKFSNPVLLQLPAQHIFGDGELSPDGSKFYYDDYIIDEDRELHQVYQMDLDAGDALAIEKSAVLMSPYTEISGCGRICTLVHRSLLVGPDGKIYVSVQDNTTKVHVIEEPNQKGSMATYSVRKLVFSKEVNTVNYNYLRSASYMPKDFAIDVKKANCIKKPVSFAILFKRIDSVKWDFGDTTSGTNNFSSSHTPQHLYPKTGTYRVLAIVYHKCFVDTANTVVTIIPDEVVKIPASVMDTVVCMGTDISINATTSFAKTYFWSDDGSTSPYKQVLYNQTYTVRTQNDCSVDSRTFSVKFKFCDLNVFLPSAFTPNKDWLNDIFRPIIKGIVKNYRFSIFSRTGNAIFATTNPADGWNGMSGRADAESGTYVYLITYYDPSTRQIFRKYGTVVLIR